jgi:diguanylate cyclase (GGDEF)-like protein
MLPLFFFVSFYFHNLKFSFTLLTIAFGLLAYIFYLRDIENAFILWNLYFGSTVLIGLAVYRIHSRILRTSQTDALTGLYNRGFSEKALSTQINLSYRHSTTLSLIYIDVDDFKIINDNYGHHQGDKVLCGIADSMRLVSRKSDIVSRWGGDEFVIILPATDIINAQDFIERLLKNLIDIEISCGLVELNKNESIDHFLTRADQSMYEVKNIKKQQSSSEEYNKKVNPT